MTRFEVCLRSRPRRLTVTGRTAECSPGSAFGCRIVPARSDVSRPRSGAASGDIAGVDVLENEGAQALDDVVVSARESTHLDGVLHALAGVSGVEVVGVHHPAPPMPGHADLQLVAQVLARPKRSLQTLVDGAPVALGVDWAALVQFEDVPADQLRVVASSTGAPTGLSRVAGPLRLRTLPLDVAGDGAHAAALVPLESCPLGLLLARGSGLEFHSRELWRLGQLGAVVGACLAVSVAV
jgi:hypothetical protein